MSDKLRSTQFFDEEKKLNEEQRRFEPVTLSSDQIENCLTHLRGLCVIQLRTAAGGCSSLPGEWAGKGASPFWRVDNNCLEANNFEAVESLPQWRREWELWQWSTRFSRSGLHWTLHSPSLPSRDRVPGELAARVNGFMPVDLRVDVPPFVGLLVTVARGSVSKERRDLLDCVKKYM